MQYRMIFIFLLSVVTAEAKLQWKDHTMKMLRVDSSCGPMFFCQGTIEFELSNNKEEIEKAANDLKDQIKKEANKSKKTTLLIKLHEAEESLYKIKNGHKGESIVVCPAEKVNICPEAASCLVGSALTNNSLLLETDENIGDTVRLQLPAGSSIPTSMMGGFKPVNSNKVADSSLEYLLKNSNILAPNKCKGISVPPGIPISDLSLKSDCKLDSLYELDKKCSINLSGVTKSNFDSVCEKKILPASESKAEEEHTKQVLELSNWISTASYEDFINKMKGKKINFQDVFLSKESFEKYKKFLMQIKGKIQSDSLVTENELVKMELMIAYGLGLFKSSKEDELKFFTLMLGPQADSNLNKEALEFFNSRFEKWLPPITMDNAFMALSEDWKEFESVPDYSKDAIARKIFGDEVLTYIKQNGGTKLAEAMAGKSEAYYLSVGGLKAKSFFLESVKDAKAIGITRFEDVQSATSNAYRFFENNSPVTGPMAIYVQKHNGNKIAAYKKVDEQLRAAPKIVSSNGEYSTLIKVEGKSLFVKGKIDNKKVEFVRKYLDDLKIFIDSELPGAKVKDAALEYLLSRANADQNIDIFSILTKERSNIVSVPKENEINYEFKLQSFDEEAYNKFLEDENISEVKLEGIKPSKAFRKFNDYLGKLSGPLSETELSSLKKLYSELKLPESNLNERLKECNFSKACGATLFSDFINAALFTSQSDYLGKILNKTETFSGELASIFRSELATKGIKTNLGNDNPVSLVQSEYFDALSKSGLKNPYEEIFRKRGLLGESGPLDVPGTSELYQQISESFRAENNIFLDLGKEYSYGSGTGPQIKPWNKPAPEQHTPREKAESAAGVIVSAGNVAWAGVQGAVIGGAYTKSRIGAVAGLIGGALVEFTRQKRDKTVESIVADVIEVVVSPSPTNAKPTTNPVTPNEPNHTTPPSKPNSPSTAPQTTPTGPVKDPTKPQINQASNVKPAKVEKPVKPKKEKIKIEDDGVTVIPPHMVDWDQPGSSKPKDEAHKELKIKLNATGGDRTYEIEEPSEDLERTIQIRVDSVTNVRNYEYNSSVGLEEILREIERRNDEVTNPGKPND